MRRQPGRPGRLVAGLHRLEVADERDLGVDHHLLAAGELHDQVGAQRAVVAADAGLLDEVAMREHAGGLDHATQLQLAPPAAHLRCPQGAHQRLGLQPQTVRGLTHGPHLLAQLGVGRGAGPLDVAELALDLAE